jgi:putative copper resistance protein D
MGISAWDVAGILDKVLLYGSTLSASGAVMFSVYTGPIMSNADARRIRKLTALLLLVAILVALLRVPLTVGAMSEDWGRAFDPMLTAMIWRAGEGRALELRLVGVVLMAFGLASRRRLLLLGLPGACLAAVSFAAEGHTHATGLGPAPIVLMGAHLLGVAFWLGGLTCLRRISAEVPPLELGRVADRFGRVALGVVALLVACGFTVLCLLVRPLSELWASPYGRGLLIKMSWILGLLVCAAINRLVWTPRLRANDLAAVRGLRRSVGFEFAFVAAILLTTAIVTSQFGPPNQP